MTSAAIESNSVVTIGIVDDHQMFTEALALIIGNGPYLNVIGSASTCAAARDLVAGASPNVLLLDVALPDGDGLSLVPELKRLSPETSILVLTSFADEKTLLRAIDSGVSGFIGKNHPIADVLAAIRQAAEGEIVMPASLLVGLLSRTAQAHRSSLAEADGEPLTPREQEILMQLAHGRSNLSIATQLGISATTVRTHIRNLLSKLGVHSRLAAVAFALQHGLIEPPI